MRKLSFALLTVALLSGVSALAQAPQVKIANGTLEGTIDSTGIHSFKGIPFLHNPL